METYVLPVSTGLLILVVFLVLLLVQNRRLIAKISVEVASLRSSNSQFEAKLAVERVYAGRVPDLEERIAKLTEQLDDQKGDDASTQSQLAKCLAINQAQQTETLDLRARLNNADAALDAATLRIENILKQKAENDAKSARLEEALQQERALGEEKLTLLREARGEMTKEFRLLASNVMQEHGETFAKQNKEQIDGILLPLREKLNDFQTGLSTAHTESLKERATLAEQIKQLSATSAVMTSETSNLTRALKGKAQTQGAWGEMILTTILEKSGLRKGEEYLVQASHTTDEGQRLRPDVIVNLPGGQRIVIDAKVSLTAFEEHVNAGNDIDRVAHLQKHLNSIKSHIKTLSSKAYQVHTNGGVDYVIMFVPIEGALALALQEDPSVTSEAVVQNVNLATPTTLMIALRTAASVWQVERRNLNAEAIATRAGQLYDKFVGFTDDMTSLGKRLNQAQSTFGDAMSKLATGNGNLLRQAEALKTLGAKTSKTMTISGVGEADDVPTMLLTSPEIVETTSSSAQTVHEQ